jgi:prepilin-type N-terminal cleavage/methylation domain-containing protein
VRLRNLKEQHGFTLLELIVVIVILGILALIAIPTYQAVMNRTYDKRSLTEMSAVTRDVQALAKLSKNGYNEADLLQILSARPAGAAAAGVQASEVKLYPALPGQGSATYGELSYQIPAGGNVLSLAMRTKDHNDRCALTSYSGATQTLARVVTLTSGQACIAGMDAGNPPAAGTPTTAPTTAPTAAPTTAPTTEPDSDSSSPTTTRTFDADGYDQNGYDIDWFDRYGYNAYGFDRDGYDHDGYDQNGMDRYGNQRFLDADGDGYDDMTGNDMYGNPRFLDADSDGFDDRTGYDMYGYNAQGCNEYNSRADGSECSG